MHPKFTPGPWTVNHTTCDGAIVRWHVAGPKWGSVYPICTHVFEGEPYASEQEANAHLIASAPDMYEAVEDAIRGLEAEFGPRVASVNFPKLYAALAKANGEQP